MKIGTDQRFAILEAALTAQAMPLARRELIDAVDLAVQTGNYWWQGCDDRQARVGLRLVTMQLRRKP